MQCTVFLWLDQIYFPLTASLCEGWFKIAPYTRLGVILPFYISYIIYWMVVA